jgi:hypothetical protein
VWRCLHTRRNYKDEQAIDAYFEFVYHHTVCTDAKHTIPHW